MFCSAARGHPRTGATYYSKHSSTPQWIKDARVERLSLLRQRARLREQGAHVCRPVDLVRAEGFKHVVWHLIKRQPTQPIHRHTQHCGANSGRPDDTIDVD